MMLGRQSGAGTDCLPPHFLGPGESGQSAEPRSWAYGWKGMESGTSRGWGLCQDTPARGQLSDWPLFCSL